jgi:hypothetical protein
MASTRPERCSTSKHDEPLTRILDTNLADYLVPVNADIPDLDDLFRWRGPPSDPIGGDCSAAGGKLRSGIASGMRGAEDADRVVVQCREPGRPGEGRSASSPDLRAASYSGITGKSGGRELSMTPGGSNPDPERACNHFATQRVATRRHRPTRSGPLLRRKCWSVPISRHSPAPAGTSQGGLYSQCQGSTS